MRKTEEEPRTGDTEKDLALGTQGRRASHGGTKARGREKGKRYFFTFFFFLILFFLCAPAPLCEVFLSDV
jgi:hypothetical protein